MVLLEVPVRSMKIPTKGKHTSSNTAPVNRIQRQLKQNQRQLSSDSQIAIKKNQDENAFSRSSVQDLSDLNRDFEKRSSRKLTICLLCMAASLTCISPYLNLHATQRIGLLLFELELIQLRSSLLSVIICGLVLVILYAIQALLSRSQEKRINNKRSLIFQKVLKYLIGFFAIISAISYLSLAFIVPQIRQIQRMPTATFDCNANLITIENCHQQFSSIGPEQTLKEAIEVLLVNELGVNHERLIRKFNCLKYNDKNSEKLQVPTRFLLHHCNLVCKPQRQQLHQFGDDLNQDQNWPLQTQAPKSIQENRSPLLRMVPPYHHETLSKSESLGDADHHYTYYNSTTSTEEQQTDSVEQNKQQVSLKVCFSGELTGSGSNYGQYCITNLVQSDHSKDRALTVGQLNAMLRRQVATTANTEPGIEDISFDQLSQQELLPSASSSATLVADQSTNYVNPIVQFESHFRNWPHLHDSDITSPFFDANGQSTFSKGSGEQTEEYQDAWCKFKPIPPLIVNNKPFNDIQCSLEHEYTMSTGPTLEATPFTGSMDKIYLKKSKNEQGSSDSGERCNIHCKVNILYQINMDDNVGDDNLGKSGKNYYSQTVRGSVSGRVNLQHYYLPLKPCLFISGGNKDKLTTTNYYLLFRSLGDAALILVFILIDIFLLLESIGTKQSPLESKKYRLSGILLTLALTPLIVGLLFDLITFWSPFTSANRAKREQPGNQLVSFLLESIHSSLSALFSSSSTIMNKKTLRSSENKYNSTSHVFDPDRSRFDSTSTPIVTLTLFDSYLVPFFANTILMFLIAINSLALPILSPTTPLLRVSSIEKLGMSSQTSIITKREKRSPARQISLDSININHPVVAKSSSPRVTSKPIKKLPVKIFSFLVIALFMGFQFNLSQIIQSEIFIENFNNPSNNQIGNEGRTSIDLTAFSFALTTQSIAPLSIFCIAILFINETSAFFSRMSVFKMSLINNLDSIEDSLLKSRISFLKHLAVATSVYFIRFMLLTRIQPNSRFKWALVFVIQVAEFINFPIIWLAISTRMHELLLMMRQQHSDDSHRDTNSISAHLIGRSLLSFCYFVLCRSLALLAHSLHTSFHLHSDNVDWFVTSFYLSAEQIEPINGKGSARLKEQLVTSQQHPSLSNGSSSFSGSHIPESLFSPLPSERQTYLHASHLFLKYNSLICLLVTIIPLAMLIYAKYQTWSQQKRTFDIRGTPTDPRDRSSDRSSCIDERLSFDLMQIHAANANTRTIPPDVTSRKRGTINKKRKQHGPRANILFHYNLNQQRTDSSDLSSVQDNTATNRCDNSRDQSQLKEEFRIPIALEEENSSSSTQVKQNDNFTQQQEVNQEEKYSYTDAEPPEAFRTPELPKEPEFLERISRSHHKKIRIIEEDEDVESRFGSRQGNLSETQGESPEGYSKEIRGSTKRISFAPSAILIGASETGSSVDSPPNKQYSIPKKASPEPSIGNESEYDDEEEVYDDDDENFEREAYKHQN